MTSTTFFIIFVPILSILLLAINLILAPHNPYQEKDSAFECGFHSFLGQNRTQFSVSFFIFGLLFLLFDLEILLIFPFALSGYINNLYGLLFTLVFIIIITIGFIFELGKSALKIDSKQTEFIQKIKPTLFTESFLSSKTVHPYPFLKKQPHTKRYFSTTRSLNSKNSNFKKSKTKYNFTFIFNILNYFFCGNYFLLKIILNYFANI